MPDGKTPAENIILYVYHTNQKGYYAPGSNQAEGKRHGHIRGWMKTGKDGAYKFYSIKPGMYPERAIPARLHPLIKEPGKTVYWIDEYVFDDEPYVDSTYRAKEEKRGGSGIIKLTRNDQGVWIGKRDLILGLNVPDYK